MDPMTKCQREPDEESPLLPSQPSDSCTRIPVTPLPKLQLSILLLLQFCEPICSQCINPFINQLITDFGINGGDEKQTGYYAGLITSLFFIAEATTVFQWSSLSDTIGRKPVLLTGLFGAGLSMACFGLSRTLAGLVISRCLAGLLNGNIGVMKSMMGEITDSTNRAQGFALIPFTYAMGSTIGPFLGGFLSNPQDRFPGLFLGSFWADYPYFLPCAASAAFMAIGFLMCLMLLKETVPTRKSLRFLGKTNAVENVADLDRPVPFRALLVYPVLVSVANYVTLAFLEAAFFGLLPLFLSTPIEYGGLALSPLQIGRWLSVMGVFTGVFQAILMAPMVRRFGPKRVLAIGVLVLVPIFAIFPLANMIAVLFGVGVLVWMVLCCQLICVLFMEQSFGCVFIYIMTSAPNKRSLGATNGLSQTTVSISRAVAKVAAPSIFALSIEHNVLGGYAVYVVFILLTGLCLLAVFPLPEGGWDETQER